MKKALTQYNFTYAHTFYSSQRNTLKQVKLG